MTAKRRYRLLCPIARALDAVETADRVRLQAPLGLDLGIGLPLNRRRHLLPAGGSLDDSCQERVAFRARRQAKQLLQVVKCIALVMALISPWVRRI